MYLDRHPEPARLPQDDGGYFRDRGPDPSSTRRSGLSTAHRDCPITLRKQIFELRRRSLGHSRYQSRRMGAERHAANHSLEANRYVVHGFPVAHIVSNAVS